MHYNNDDVKPVNSLESDSQKIVIFDDFICDKNQKPLIDYFIQGRHKKCYLPFTIILQNSKRYQIKQQSLCYL